MALITCPDCNTPMSDRAAACLKCGAPIALPRTDATVTEQTGKAHKIVQALGVLASCIGIVMVVAGNVGTGTMLLMGGALTFLIARITAWWSHG
jgi:Mg/Co/Ni transporter MgtE